MKPIITLSALPGISPDHPQADWLVGPVGQSRDSDTVERSNWTTVTTLFAELDPDGVDHEVHRFGRWACGWIEEIAYRPGSKVAAQADAFRARLDGYPILDEHAHSALECAETDQAWEDWQAREVRNEVNKLLAADLTEEEFSDFQLWEVASQVGESYDGSLHLSSRNYQRITDKIVDLLAAK